MVIIMDSVIKPVEAVVPSNSVSQKGVRSQQVGILLVHVNETSIKECDDPESIKVTILETMFDDNGIDKKCEEGITFSFTVLCKTV